MFVTSERKKIAPRALLIGIQKPSMPTGEGAELLAELKELVETLGITVTRTSLVTLREPHAHYLVGSGKAEELMEAAREDEADILVFDDDLSPAQQRNWEKASGKAVIDRQEVILDVFAQRAHTREAILQVGLARMEYSLPRLKRAWTHLSRQRGGGTGARGQGETQLESDRRLVKDRIAHLRRNLEEVVQQRQVQRQRRIRHTLPNAAIVGYTNAGKSSLLNRLTGSEVIVQNKLFATLDPTTRQLALPANQKLLVTDTVGFIRRLPHGLVEAFKATLEEVVVADFLIHVLDVTNPKVDRHQKTTAEVLGEIGADGKKVITVFNKVDAADEAALSRARLLSPGALFVSAKTGEGLDLLLQRCSDLVAEEFSSTEFLIPHHRYDLVAKLHECGCIRTQDTRDEGVYIEGRLPPASAGQYLPFVLAGARS